MVPNHTSGGRGDKDVRSRESETRRTGVRQYVGR